ncbi:MAG: selenoneine synthase SenA [bacterium]
MNPPDFSFELSSGDVQSYVRDVIEKTLMTVEGLDSSELIGPYSPRLNPLLWELTHSLWFLERWTLREFEDLPPHFDDVDWLYNSPEVRHGQRWAEDLVPFSEVETFASTLSDSLVKTLENNNSPEFLYYTTYAVLHSDMHTEALTYQRQTRGLAAPPVNRSDNEEPPIEGSNLSGDVHHSGGKYPLGADQSAPFAFDNEKWAHDVSVDPFELSRTPVTNQQFVQFVEAGGYENQSWWSDDGWQWLQQSGQNSPRYWKKKNGEWYRRFFDNWQSLEPNHPVIYVNFYEAQAYCKWSDRRLPAEAEWELAASGWTESNTTKRTYPWGDSAPDETKANLDWTTGGTVDVGCYPDGDSRQGCRQMIGNCWEWTQSQFKPFPGFEPDFYKQYSQPWFGSRKVLRGGSWMTRSRLIRNGYRSFFTPDRNDIPAGFRTCSK